MDYVGKHPEIHVHSVRVDDGYSGVDFNRPNFQQMLDDIRTGSVDCVIVKDLSRFGRNYIEAGRYIEKIFPMMGVRFIAVTDGYDSLNNAGSSEMMVPFKNLINDAYSRDISIKIRSNLEVKRKRLDPPRAYYRYVCPTYQNLKEKGCTKKHLNKKETEQAVEEAVRLHIKLFLDSRKALDGLNRTEQARRINDGYQKELSETCRQKKKAQQRAGALYNDYADGILNESDYLYAKQKYLDEAAAAEQRILELREMQKKYNKGFTKDSRLETMAGQYMDFDVLTDEIVHAFIEKIYVHSDKSLEICFRFRDELEELVQTVEERKGEVCRTETDM